MAWLWLVGALVLGGVLLLAAAVTDIRARRDADKSLTHVPLRGIEDVDARIPAFVAQHEIDELAPAPGTTAPSGRRFPFGIAHPDLLPRRGAASLDAARVLIVEGEITSMRQLIHHLGGDPLLVVASGMDDEVGATLAANAKKLQMPVLACVAGPGDLIEFADHVGAEILTADDLRAGYVPPAALGAVAGAAANARHTWVSLPTTPRP